jgi:hypothetical protein
LTQACASNAAQGASELVEVERLFGKADAMMRAPVLVMLAAALLAGCKQQPLRQPRLSDGQLQAIRTDAPGMSEDCLNKLKWGGIGALPNDVGQCFKFTPPKRMQGLWRNQFEGSDYCEDQARPCPDKKMNASHGFSTWLEMRAPLPGARDTPPGGLYAIDFVGRRSVGAGKFGHFGMWRNEVIVDRLLSIKEVEPPPPQPTKAEFIKEMKACEARKTCIPNWTVINGYDQAQDKKARIEAYLKNCAGKPICMPNSEVPKQK